MQILRLNFVRIKTFLIASSIIERVSVNESKYLKFRFNALEPTLLMEIVFFLLFMEI